MSDNQNSAVFFLNLSDWPCIYLFLVFFPSNLSLAWSFVILAFFFPVQTHSFGLIRKSYHDFGHFFPSDTKWNKLARSNLNSAINRGASDICIKQIRDKLVAYMCKINVFFLSFFLKKKSILCFIWIFEFAYMSKQ